MSILSDIALKKAKPQTERYSLKDGLGLFFIVEPSGSRYWHFRFSWAKKQQRISLGVYPDIGLRDARQLRDEARMLIARGIDPRDQREIDEAQANQLLFEEFVQEWLVLKRLKLSQGGNVDVGRKSTIKQLEAYLDKDILPVLGKVPIKNIRRSDVLIIQKNMEARGALHIASKCRRWLNEMFRAAVVQGHIEVNPATDMDVVALPEPPQKHHPHLKMAELPAFLNALEDYPGDIQTKLGIKLLFLTGVRTIELRKAEPRHFDLEKNLWIIPAKHVKQLQRKAKSQSEEVPPYIVPLSRQAKEIVQYLISVRFPWQKYLLLHRTKPEKIISENTLNYGIGKRLGYAGKLNGHGVRGTISTALNELGYEKDWIEAQLSHSQKDAIRAAYNHAEYIEQRRQMMQEWADRLDAWTQEGLMQKNNSGAITMDHTVLPDQIVSSANVKRSLEAHV